MKGGCWALVEEVCALFQVPNFDKTLKVTYALSSESTPTNVTKRISYVASFLCRNNNTNIKEVIT